MFKRQLDLVARMITHISLGGPPEMSLRHRRYQAVPCGNACRMAVASGSRGSGQVRHPLVIFFSTAATAAVVLLVLLMIGKL